MVNHHCAITEATLSAMHAEVVALRAELEEANRWRKRHSDDAAAYGKQTVEQFEQIESLQAENRRLLNLLGECRVFLGGSGYRQGENGIVMDRRRAESLFERLTIAPDAGRGYAMLDLTELLELSEIELEGSGDVDQAGVFRSDVDVAAERRRAVVWALREVVERHGASMLQWQVDLILRDADRLESDAKTKEGP